MPIGVKCRYGQSNIHRTLDFCTDHQGKNWIYQSYRLARVLLSNLYIVKPAIEKHILLYNNQQQRKHFSHFPPPSATYVRMYVLSNSEKWGQCLSDFVLHLQLAISKVSILDLSKVAKSHKVQIGLRTFDYWSHSPQKINRITVHQLL